MYLNISRDSKESLTTQFFKQIKTKILKGELSGGYKLPSTRDLAGKYGVSRNIIIDVYEQLNAEGYINSITGDGSYINDNLVFDQGDLPELPLLNKGGFLPFDRSVIDFKSGLPDLLNFPMSRWLNITKEVYQNYTINDLAYGEPAGDYELREAISEYVKIHRGVKCQPEQIVITGGTTQAIGLICSILLKDKREVILEDPLTKDIYEIVTNNNGNAIPLPSDNEGIQICKINKDCKPCFIYTAPSHSFPLGITMSIKRRIELIEYAKGKDSYIIEDDYDSEFRYDVSPTPSLQGLYPSKVIYIGTFSKTLFPGLRIGYLILPPNLINNLRRAKWLHDLHNSTLEQRVLAKFVSDGHYVRHINRMKKIYKSKREFIVKELNRLFKDSIELIGNKVGMHIAIKFIGTEFSRSLIDELYNSGVKIYPVEEHSLIKGSYSDTILLGYGSLTREQITNGLEILKSIIIS